MELITYWSTYLYCRCDRSVSIATPVMYAHWASRRARNLSMGGASAQELENISKLWLSEDRPSNMFFV